MREIRFRGKRLDNGEWLYGDLQHHWDGLQRRISDYCGGNPVDPSTVGQYTGLKDKNGKEIYEGDILRDVDTAHITTVLYSSPAFVLRDDKGYFYWIYHADEKEVIGNIHDNPELLGGEQRG